MMKILQKALISVGVAVALILSSIQSAEAGTIIKLSLGDDTVADFRYTGGVLSTIDDGDFNTDGLQTTNIEFLDFLSSYPAVTNGSYSLAGVTAFGAPLSFSIGGIPHVAQDFQGGTFTIWDQNDVKLLEVNLDGSALVGPIGGPATGSSFTTTFANVVGGTLAGEIADNSLSMSISLASILSNNGQSGLRLASGALRGFTADGTKLIAASPAVPEPTAIAILFLGTVLGMAGVRRGQR